MENLEFKGTKEPWRQGGKGEESRVFMGNHLFLEGVWDLEGKFKTDSEIIEETNANAQLIAAAPELLEACIEVVKGYEGDGMENMQARDEVFYKICKEAINKALGK